MIYYIYNGDELLGFIYNSKTYYYHKNIFGDIIGILDSNYNEIVTYEYDSWGALINITDNSGINLGTINPFRYRSYYYDTETGLYYLNSRYYNPEWGRFINADNTPSTGQDFTGMNMFCYCGNNPITRMDVGGQFWILLASYVAATVGLTAYGALCGTMAYWGQIESNRVLGIENIYSGTAGAWIGGAIGGIVGITHVLPPFTGVLVGELVNSITEDISAEESTRNIIVESSIALGYSTKPFGSNPLYVVFDTYTSTYATNIINTTLTNAANTKTNTNDSSKSIDIKSFFNNASTSNDKEVYGPPIPSKTDIYRVVSIIPPELAPLWNRKTPNKNSLFLI